MTTVDDALGEDRGRGLYDKYEVRRRDGSSSPGGEHERCCYYVLDLDHDQYALAALATYAESCSRQYPLLARDLRNILRLRGFRRRGGMVARKKNVNIDEQLADQQLYIEVSDSTLRKYAEGMLSANITRSHTLSQIVRMADGQWLLKMSPDILKRMNEK